MWANAQRDGRPAEYRWRPLLLQQHVYTTHLFIFQKMSHLLLIAAQERKLPKPRVFRDGTQPLESLDDEELVARYRLDRHCITDLCHLLATDLERYAPTDRALCLYRRRYYQA